MSADEFEKGTRVFWKDPRECRQPSDGAYLQKLIKQYPGELRVETRKEKQFRGDPLLISITHDGQQLPGYPLFDTAWFTTSERTL